ncbi:APC family permease [Myxococcus landrumensis]|uniref:Amino acid permease n=1 Tax=Myxococcus landrumensis TaxID=2813577 RepID=A0ABX7N380_9BACT|nr:APC family permease [Myxococcus landrumus]QSQ13187.1 amino acid permease [Myxococcus landrumus]
MAEHSAKGAPARRATMSVWSVAALGIGSMVGAGIFALLGQAALLVGPETWLAFALAGVVAVLSGYSYAKLSARYPSSGGITRFFEEAFGRGVVSGTLSLIYLVTLVISVAMVAKTFGAYATKLFIPSGGHGWFAVFGSLIVILLAALNVAGSGAVGRAEVILVSIKLVILAVLLAAGLWSMSTGGTRDTSTDVHLGLTTLVSSVGLCFFAYSGFGMMANAGADVANPRKTIPRAIYLAIGVVTLLYVGLSITVLALVPPDQLARDADTAVAQAARPVLGNAGFTVVALGALLATASAINATLFAALNVSSALAHADQLPKAFSTKFGHQGTRGFLWGVVAILVMVNTLSLGAIANIASATFLVCYLAAHVACWKLARQTGASKVVVGIGMALMAIVLGTFLVSTGKKQPLSLLLILLAVAGSALVQWLIQSRHHGGLPHAPSR